MEPKISFIFTKLAFKAIVLSLLSKDGSLFTWPLGKGPFEAHIAADPEKLAQLSSDAKGKIVVVTSPWFISKFPICEYPDDALVLSVEGFVEDPEHFAREISSYGGFRFGSSSLKKHLKEFSNQLTQLRSLISK